MKDFNDMTGPELVAAYNEMADAVGDVRHVNRFESLVAGIHRCQKLAQHVRFTETTDIPESLRRPFREGEEKETGPMQVNVPTQSPNSMDSVEVEADRRWRNWTPRPGMMSRPRKAVFVRMVREERIEAAKTALTASTPKLSNASRSKRADRVIRVLVDANPRRAGTEAHRYFEQMTGGITVGEYVSRFPEGDHRKAVQWLYNTCKDGYVKLLG